MKKVFVRFLLVTAMMAALCKPAQARNEYREVLDEGFVYEGEGYSMVVRWCKEGEADLFGRMWLPADFDENVSYPALVMCHGHMGNCDFWDKYFGPEMARRGYVCYAIDCRSSYDGQRDHSTPNDDHVATVSTYARDVVAATEFMLGQSFVDQENLYLAGQSMGGMGIQAAAAQIPEKVQGLIVLYGFLSESVREMMDCYEEVVAKPYDQGEVLMLGGTLDAACAPENVEQNMALYENSTMVLISGARHGFGKEDGRAERISAAAMDDFIRRTRETAQ